jgi:arsenic resistance protein ArsH
MCEELVKTTLLLLPHRILLDDRYSEREEKKEHGRLRTQAETEAAKLKSYKKQKVDGSIEERVSRGLDVGSTGSNEV